jgi:hypothetical protein
MGAMRETGEFSLLKRLASRVETREERAPSVVEREGGVRIVPHFTV